VSIWDRIPASFGADDKIFLSSYLPTLPSFITKYACQKREIFGWAMYDFANSAFATTILAVIALSVPSFFNAAIEPEIKEVSSFTSHIYKGFDSHSQVGLVREIINKKIKNNNTPANTYALIFSRRNRPTQSNENKTAYHSACRNNNHLLLNVMQLFGLFCVF
jgi:hypothetical protein